MISPIIKLYFVGLVLFTIASLPFLLFIFVFHWFGFALYSVMMFLFFCFPETLINIYSNYFKRDVARTMQKRARWGVTTSSDEIKRMEKAGAIIDRPFIIPSGALVHLRVVGLILFSSVAYQFWKMWSESARQVHFIFLLTYLAFAVVAFILLLSRAHPSRQTTP